MELLILASAIFSGILGNILHSNLFYIVGCIAFAVGIILIFTKDRS